MSPINCVRCGCLNGSGAGDCERCRTPLNAAGYDTHDVTVAPYAAPALAAGRLPIDFPFAPFQGVGDALKPTLRLYRDNFLLGGGGPTR